MRAAHTPPKTALLVTLLALAATHCGKTPPPPADAAVADTAPADAALEVAAQVKDTATPPPDATIADIAPLPDPATATADTAELPDAATPQTADAAVDSAGPDLATPDVPQPSPLTAKGQFVDNWANLGVKLATAPPNKAMLKEASSSAGMLIDLDKDNLLDWVVVDGIDKAYWGRNIKPWKWFDAPLLTAKEPGLRSIAATDVDGDGYPEIVLGGGRLYFLVRTKFETYNDEASYRGLATSKQAHVQHIATCDLDNDGLLDLVTTEYSCSDAATVRGHLNQGNGNYSDETYALGIGHKTTAWFTLPYDADSDGQVDLLIGHENCEPAKGNIWYHNKGFVLLPPRFGALKVPPVFMAPQAGGVTPMGGSVGDANGDGLLDIVLTSTGMSEMVSAGLTIAKAKANPALAADYASLANQLLLQQPDGSYQPAGLQWGLGWATSQTNKTMVSWSARFFDFDGDGWQDIYINHGDNAQALLLSDEGGTRPVLFRNNGLGQFDDVSDPFGLPALHGSRGLSAADVDNDGDLDFLEGGMDSQPLFLENQVDAPKHWLAVRLKGNTSNVWGIGARLLLTTSGKPVVAAMGASAPTQTNDPAIAQLVWPLAWQAQQLQVFWPSGYVQTLAVNGVDKMLWIEEPPLVQLSARFVNSAKPANITVTARAYDTTGLAKSGVVTTIELAANAKGSWQGPTACAPDGTCTRTWMPVANGWGADAIEVSFGGKLLAVRPVIRFDKVF